MKNIFKQLQSLFMPLGILIIILLCYIGIILMSRANRAQTILLSQDLVLEVERERRGKEMAVFLKDIEEKQENLTAYFAKEETIVDIIEELEGLAETTGVSVQILEVNTGKDAQNHEMLSVELFSQGNWQGILHILTLLESLPVQSTISHMALDAHTGEDSIEQWTMAATLNVGLKSI